MMSPLWMCLLLVLGSSHGARILGIFPTPSISHQLPFQAVMKALASRGHQVTVLSPNPLKTRHANYTDVDLSFTYDFLLQGFDPNHMVEITPLQMPDLLQVYSSLVCDLQLSSKVMQDFIKSEPEFDLVIIESLIYQCMYGLVHLAGSPPLIGIQSMGGTASTFESVGNPNNPAYLPDPYLPYGDHMTFWERAHSLIYMIYSKYRGDELLYGAQEDLMRRYFGPDPPSVWETEKNFSLIMLSNHWTTNYAKPLLPNMIMLGAMHIEPSKPLDKDLAEFLDGASDGFVYFSLGSNVRSDKLPERRRQQLLEAFAQLPQRVLWKWESDTLPGQPSNVKLGKWLPQQDILAHPNIRLFVTQGGLQSYQEAVHHAVPLVVIPFIGDQKYNARKIASSGVGLELRADTATAETYLATFREVINNRTYRDTMKRVSDLAKDQPEPPIERAVWWTEYVLRHNGAKHLRSAALDLTWWQYLLLDVFAVLFTALVLTLLTAYHVVKTLLKLLLNIISSKKKENKNKKRN